MKQAFNIKSNLINHNLRYYDHSYQRIISQSFKTKFHSLVTAKCRKTIFLNKKSRLKSFLIVKLMGSYGFFFYRFYIHYEQRFENN